MYRLGCGCCVFGAGTMGEGDWQVMWAAAAAIEGPAVVVVVVV